VRRVVLVARAEGDREREKKGMLDAQMSTWLVDAMMELHAIDKAGYAAAVTEDVRKLLGRPATRFVDWAKKHASAWKS
jgi:hypothetical protein